MSNKGDALKFFEGLAEGDTLSIGDRRYMAILLEKQTGISFLWSEPFSAEQLIKELPQPEGARWHLNTEKSGRSDAMYMPADTEENRGKGYYGSAVTNNLGEAVLIAWWMSLPGDEDDPEEYRKPFDYVAHFARERKTVREHLRKAIDVSGLESESEPMKKPNLNAGTKDIAIPRYVERTSEAEDQDDPYSYDKVR